ncbi:beta-glucanase [Flavobacterium sp. L1I52]|uniref:Beta-glucanase n=1 Tax=Flavobacterium pokkalii TaxID=1940408 RepID=A0ABR7URA8_9FLAO|nr:glycoside hydrolase family 16 protein [Flavobacterium pokkalii]MBD0725446.1 beta-glucanase [Flavobacterium pokkalii]
MKFNFLVLGVVSIVVFGFVTKSERTFAEKEYKLVWSDEFSVDGVPDEKNWSYETGFVRNHEKQWYQKENAYCKNGFLIIEAKKEHKVNPNFISKNHPDWTKKRDSIKVTSSCLITRDKHSWQYGRFEMRAKIPVAKGMWPAFWTLGVKGNWPENGEIDIMEYYRGKILANVAWKSDKKDTQWDSTSHLLSDFKKVNWANEFHVWRMDWDANSINLYVDNQLLNETSVTGTMQGKNHKVFPFKQPHYLLLNLAVGGDQGGSFSRASFPSKYVVDYVRVYQKK